MKLTGVGAEGGDGGGPWIRRLGCASGAAGVKVRPAPGQAALPAFELFAAASPPPQASSKWGKAKPAAPASTAPSSSLWSGLEQGS